MYQALIKRKTKVYCYDRDTNTFFRYFKGYVMERNINRNNYYIRQKLDKKPFFYNINWINYKLLLKSKQ